MFPRRLPYYNSVTALGTLLFEALAFYSEFVTEKEDAKGRRTRWPTHSCVHLALDKTSSRALTMFFATIVRFNTEANLISRWVNGRRRIVLLLLSEASNLYSDSRICQKIEYSDKIGWGISVRVFQNFVLEMNPDLDLATEGVHPALLLTPHTPSRLLQVCDSVMRLARKDWACFVPGCTKAYHGDVADSQFCSACQVVGYCSRDCQRADWKVVEHPHRKVCPALHYFSRKSQVQNGLPIISMSIYMLAERYVANGGDEETVTLLHEWHTERRARSHVGFWTSIYNWICVVGLYLTSGCISPAMIRCFWDWRQ